MVTKKSTTILAGGFIVLAVVAVALYWFPQTPPSSLKGLMTTSTTTRCKQLDKNYKHENIEGVGFGIDKYIARRWAIRDAKKSAENVHPSTVGVHCPDPDPDLDPVPESCTVYNPSLKGKANLLKNCKNIGPPVNVFLLMEMEEKDEIEKMVFDENGMAIYSMTWEEAQNRLADGQGQYATEAVKVVVECPAINVHYTAKCMTDAQLWDQYGDYNAETGEFTATGYQEPTPPKETTCTIGEEEEDEGEGEEEEEEGDRGTACTCIVGTEKNQKPLTELCGEAMYCRDDQEFFETQRRSASGDTEILYGRCEEKEIREFEDCTFVPPDLEKYANSTEIQISCTCTATEADIGENWKKSLGEIERFCEEKLCPEYGFKNVSRGGTTIVDASGVIQRQMLHVHGMCNPEPEDPCGNTMEGNLLGVPCEGCGNGICDPAAGEDTLNCPMDCPSDCGDGMCDPGEETTCSADCPSVCGDGMCDPGEETTCSADCPSDCGDGMCDPGEETTCSADCPSDCGDGMCDDTAGENSINCPMDCFY